MDELTAKRGQLDQLIASLAAYGHETADEPEMPAPPAGLAPAPDDDPAEYRKTGKETADGH